MTDMASPVKNKLEEQKYKFELFLQENGIKSFKQYSSVIEWKMCREDYETEGITEYTNLFECTDPEEFDEIMPKLLDNPLFQKAKKDKSKGNFSDHDSALKWYSKFLHKEMDAKYSSNRMIVIDMNSGSYSQERTGHEIYNLEKNPIDGRFYGYCPPHDDIDICARFGAKSRTGFVEDILVVYVTKKESSNNREIIGFIPKAKIYGTKQPGERLCRFISDSKNPTPDAASYSVESDNLIDLRNQTNKFEIEIAKYNSYIFRGQRYYGGYYPELDKAIIAYVESILKIPNDDIEDQEKIQRSEEATSLEIQGAADKKPSIISGSQGKVVAKDGRIAKAALVRKAYTCQIDSSHKTFQTTRGVSYMEGHHLIPCTAANAENFWNKYGKSIDCLENIVCICPTCHRAVHFGDKPTKEKMVKRMYKQHADQLLTLGISISEEVLLELYDIITF